MPENKKYVLTEREVRFMRDAAIGAKTTLALPRQRFLAGLEMDFQDARKANMSLLLVELQKDASKIDPNLVLGYDYKTDRVMWYYTTTGQYWTSVPFGTEQEMPEIKYPDPSVEIARAFEEEEKKKLKEAQRILHKIPVKRKPWYARDPNQVLP